MADLYPIYLSLEDKPCLVVGGGRVAYRKVKGLLEAKAKITLVSPQCEPELLSLAAEGAIALHERPFENDDVKGMWLVFCATDVDKVNRAVFEASEAARVPANVADQPHICRFHVPGRYKEGALQIAVSTRGGSPALSRRLRQGFSDTLSPWAPRLVEWMARLRPLLKARLPGSASVRGAFLNRIVDERFDTLKAWAQQNDRASFDAFIQEALDQFEKNRSEP
ncbi:MAG: bifunctional precorrin-2 dehydrogenase/sirohydrochlorin ferrochelatase [Planctomycetota bacterium]